MNKADVAAKKLFNARVACLQRGWREQPEKPGIATVSDIDEILKRLGSDKRMQGTWNILATLSNPQFEFFLEDAILGARGWLLRPGLRDDHRGKHDRIVAAIAIIKKLEDICDVPLFSPPLLDWMSEPDELDTIADNFPDLPEQLWKLKTALLARDCRMAAEVEPYVGGLSRKFGDGRTGVMRKLADIVKWTFGAPHYHVVATLTNVILDISEDDRATPDAARKAATRPNRTIGADNNSE